MRGMVQSDDCAQVLADETGCGSDATNFCIHWRAPGTGNYKLRVQGRTAAVEGEYLLRYRQSDCPPDGWEPDGGCGQATVLEPDYELKRQGHTICPGGELDFYEFFALAGESVHIFTEGGTDTAGAVLAEGCERFLLKDESCDGVDPNFCMTFQARETGRYKVAVTGDAAGGPYDLFYQQVTGPDLGCVTDGAEPDDVCGQGSVIFPSTTEQEMDRTLCPPDDRDYFTFQAVAGQSYEFWSTGTTDTKGSVRDLDCNVLAWNDDCSRPGDLNFCLRWTAPENGTYHVRVKGFSRDLTVGPYTFHYLQD